LIEQVASVLKDLNYRIQVNGFTDNAPIHSAQFDSNWDLSAARAISVVKRFVADGIDPTLLVGAGFGEYHPVASNNSLEGMAMNRRVSIVVVSPGGRDDPAGTPLLGDPEERNAEEQHNTPETDAPANQLTVDTVRQSSGCSGEATAGAAC